MAHLNGTFFSQSLCRPVHYTAVLCNDIAMPTTDNPNFKRPTKNVYLLHGYSGTDTDWFAESSTTTTAKPTFILSISEMVLNDPFPGKLL